MKIMSVDDSQATRHFIRNAVEVLGYSFAEAEHGQQAIDYLQKYGAVDLILLDWNMPVMDGITTLKQLKSDAQFMGIPVTMVTTEIEKEKVIEAIGAGAKNYVMKPFSQEDLIKKILESLGMGM